MIIEETDGKILVKKEGFKLMRPEQTGLNQLKNGSARDAFLFWLDNWSDIQDHLMFMFQEARGNVLELGTRGGVSTSALLSGVECNGGFVHSVDFDPECWMAFDGHPKWTFTCADSLDEQVIAKDFPRDEIKIDLLFIDTDHIYSRLKKELELWVPKVRPGGLVMFHDIFAYPEMEKAAAEYAAQHHIVYEKRPGSNGLGVFHVDANQAGLRILD